MEARAIEQIAGGRLTLIVPDELIAWSESIRQLVACSLSSRKRPKIRDDDPLLLGHEIRGS